VEAVTNVLKSIIRDESKVIKKETTEKILNAVSNLVMSDFRITNNQAETVFASKIGDGYSYSSGRV
jgi:hypothetical protein